MLTSVLSGCSSSASCSPLSLSCTNPRIRNENRISSLPRLGFLEWSAAIRSSSWLIGTELGEFELRHRGNGRPCGEKWSRGSPAGCSAAAAAQSATTSRTQRMMESIRSGEEADACRPSLYRGLQQADLQGGRPRDSWSGIGTEPGPVPDAGRSLLNAAAAAALGLLISVSGADVAQARPEGVNRPELLPESFTTVIDVAGFLSSQQEGRIAQDLASIEEETGFKLRVLAQNYPETPGLAIKNYWQVDDNTIVFVADPSLGNILNFNVGSSVDLNVPRSFWSRLQGKYGNIFYWREMGEDASIEAAVAAIGQCLREPAGPYACAEIK